MWTSRSEDRLHEWKLFRESLANLPFSDALEATSHFWSFAPFVKHHLDLNHPEEWPGPWQLLSDNIYCDLAKALGMMHTLLLSGHRNHQYMLVILQDQFGEMRHVVSVDNGFYMLNMEFDEVVNTIPAELTVIASYSPEQINTPSI